MACDSERSDTDSGHAVGVGGAGVLETNTLPSPSVTAFKRPEPNGVCHAKDNMEGSNDPGTYPVCEALP